jgi:REP element-mobilizing transposase RayT
MPHTKVCIHYVWSTKNRVPLLTSTLRKELFEHISMNAYSKKIHIDRINGYLEHIHCLIWLKPGQTIDGIMKLVKGESAYWFNKSQGKNSRLEWQNDYFAVSVSQSMLDTVRVYIDNQENHHRKQTFEQEYNAFMKRYSFQEE